MTEASFLVVGEALVDLISEAGTWEFAAAPGGSPLNVAVGLAAAGQHVRLASEVGDDLFGGLVREHLAFHGVDPADLVTTAAATNLAFARLDAAGGASYDFRLGWSWRGRPELAGVSCLHVGSLGAVLAPGAAAVRDIVAHARRRGVPVSYDPNVRPTLMGALSGPSPGPPATPAGAEDREADRSGGDRLGAEAARPAVEALVAAADLVKVSSDDLAWLYPGTPPEQAGAGWLPLGPRLVVVTRGPGGAVALSREHTIECAAPRIEVVDTVGAGDAFTAALLSSLARAGALADQGRAAVESALRHATAVAAATCLHRGAAPPPPELVARLS